MPDIVNAGVIVLIGVFTLVAVIGAADELGQDGPAFSANEPERRAISVDEASDGPDVEVLSDQGDGDDRADERSDDHKRDREDRHRDDEGDDEVEEDDG